MDNDKTMKRKSISLIAKNLILLLSVAFTGVIGAWSWFTNNTTATADGISVSCEAPDSIEIAVVEHGAPAPADDAYTVGKLELDENSSIIKQLKLTEITSDGIVFYKPQLQQNNGKAEPITGVDWNQAYAGRDYMSFDLYIRSKAKMKIFLDSVSSVEPIGNVLTGPNSTDKSVYGDFSKDCIVGATRLAFLDSSAQRQLLWIPRPDLELKQGNNTFYVNEKLLSGKSYAHDYWVNSTQKVENYSEAYPSKVNINGDKVNVTLGESKQIALLDKESETDEYYRNYVTCNLWIEGEDNEARLALAGGKFKINLKLACEQDS